MDTPRDFSLPLPRVAQPSSTIQIYLGSIAHELVIIKSRLRCLAELILPEPEACALLSGELAEGMAVVRTDLLADAITTLIVLAELTESDISRRRAERSDLMERLGDA